MGKDISQLIDESSQNQIECPSHPQEECPLHPKEYLEFKYIGIYTPEDSDGTAYPFYNYCPTLNKIFDGEKMITLEEAALNFLNSVGRNLKLEDIEIEEDLSKLTRKASD